MSNDHYKPSTYLTRKIEDILKLDENDIRFATKALLNQRIEQSKSRRSEQDIILGIDVVDEAVKLQLAYNSGLRGLSSGFSSIDRLTKGFVAGEVTIIAARTSVGKTSLALAIAANITEQGKPVLFVTLEMTQAQLMQRYISYTGGLTNDQPSDKFMDIAGLTYMQKSDKVSPQSIEGIIKNAKDNDAQLVVLDHLHYFSRGSQTDDVEVISMELSRTAKKYEIPIIAIAHTRKDAIVGRKGKDTVMDDIRGASFISQDADIVLILNRNSEINELRVTCWKNRNGGIDSDNTARLKMKGSNISEDWSS